MAATFTTSPTDGESITVGKRKFTYNTTKGVWEKTGSTTVENFARSSVTADTLTVGDITLPSTDGSSGQVLTTDGSGNVTWTTVSGGGSDTLRWNDYAMNWAQEPTSQGAVTLNGTAGVKYLYTYASGVTAYRFVPDTYDATKDAFYSDSNLTTLLATKGMTI